MKPKFTTPCFIRKNTPELRRKLEELGYNHRQQWPDKNKDKCRILFVENDSYFYHYAESRPKVFFYTHIDCGTNETLFLAIAALREDSDKFQWFCDDYCDEFKSFFLCEYDNVGKHIHEKMDGWDCDGFHKATIGELINHFKN